MEKNDVKIFALIACAGTGSRAGLPYNKLLYEVNGKTIAGYTLDNFKAAREQKLVTDIIILCGENDRAAFAALAGNYGAALTTGGASRAGSVRNGLEYIEKELSPSGRDIVLVCDGARPNCEPGIIERCVRSAIDCGSGVAAVPVPDTVKTAADGVVYSTPGREKLFAAQTPQAFNFRALYSAYLSYEKAAENGAAVPTDDSAVMELYGGGAAVRLVKGSPVNYKITTAYDIKRFESEKAAYAHKGICGYANLRTGIGSDMHRFAKDRKLVLGGVEIQHHSGLMGHSDADALIHSMIDALLAALNLRDIGYRFPDTDPAFKDISSMELLRRTAAIFKEKAELINISAVIHAQNPKLNPYIPRMAANIAAALGVDPGLISISAKTGEGVGIIGEEKAVSCEAACLVYLRGSPEVIDN